MSAKVINIARNTSYYTLALVVQKVISFTYFVIIARALGPEDLGKYYFAISFTTIFAIIIDLGLSNVLTREVAKNHDSAQKYLSNVLGLKIPLAFLAVAIVAALSVFFDYSPLVRTLILISSASMVFDSFTLTFFGVMRGHHNLRFESLSAMIFQLIVLASGLFAMWLGWGLVYLIAALALASVFNFFFSLSVVKFQTDISLKPTFDKIFIKGLIVITAPFAIFAVLQRVYTYLDAVLLQKLAGDRAVGIYQVSFKIIVALQFLPMAFSASLYPAFATYWQKNREQLAVTFERAMNYLLILAAPISIGVLATADKIILLFNAEYRDAVAPLQVSMIALSFIFLNFAVGALLNACDRQKYNTMVMAATTVLSISLNIILIPKMSALGATWTVAITNLFSFVIGMLIVPSVVKYNYRKVALSSTKIILAAVMMGAISYYLKAYLNIFIVVVFAGAAYFIFLYAFQVFRKEDMLSIVASFRRN